MAYRFTGAVVQSISILLSSPPCSRCDTILNERAVLLAEQVKQVDVIFPPGGDAALIEQTPLTGEEGRFSVEYVIALAVFGQTLTLDAFTKNHSIRHAEMGEAGKQRI